MAMNYHMEARRRQRFMERVCEARKRLAAGAAAPDGNDQRLQCGMINSCTSQSDPVISTDQGQFYQSRPSQLKELKDQKVFSGVVFKELIHDPNFYYRSAIEIGEEPPLHVNPIYKIIYPGCETQKQHK
ncbi:uncharacterized protein LOC131950007 isoform X2 [Physella acuta]|uniref:uncharacterized protein LOC131950007 isoform X2 n=1 Tax=Physella acuta TaxID=109671 RepID=UPI0027DD6FBE|nr:uncharacterized protein LOC131950007 isoform X2 [Physella acuta]